MVDEKTGAQGIVDYAHHEIHSGSAYCAHVIASDMDKSDEINICFTTPNSLKYLRQWNTICRCADWFIGRFNNFFIFASKIRFNRQP